MRTIEEVKKEIIDSVEWGQKKPEFTGGQSCGIPNYPVILRSDILDFEITIGYHRSSYKNKQLAYTLFELALDELIR